MPEREHSPFNTRGWEQYWKTLFADDLFGDKEINEIYRPQIPQSQGLVEHANAQGTETVDMARTNQYFGGINEFFKEGNTIIDLGCGYGKAVSELAKGTKTTVVGMDMIFEHRSPIDPENGLFVAGRWENLPFANNTFDGILGCESFPRHWNHGDGTDEKIFDEITRVAKPGAVWRATTSNISSILFQMSPNAVAIDSTTPILKELMIPRGWDLYLKGQLMVAQLKK